MKKLITLLSLTAVALSLPVTALAAKKAPATPAAATATPAPASDAKKPATKPADPNKPLGMYVKVDTIDAAGKTFSHTNKDGKVVKFVVTDKTDIKNGDAAAKLSDVKVGDTVSGSRIKKSDTEYEVVKITKFGVVAPKPKKADAAAKPEEKKPQ